MIDFEERGDITVLAMAAGRGNALNVESLDALSNALAQLERGPSRAAVITGRGTIFSAGADLPAIVAGGADYVRRFLPALSSFFERLARFPKPLVAAVNGHAIAGGAILMLGCDQRILARGGARIGLTEILVGVEFPAWALELARFPTPPQHFPTLICTGRTWPPDEALARGLVDELCDPARLLDRSVEVAAEMSAIPPATFAATKMAVRQPMFDAAEKRAKVRDADVTEQWCSPDVLKQAGEFVARHIARRG